MIEYWFRKLAQALDEEAERIENENHNTERDETIAAVLRVLGRVLRGLS